MANGQAVSGVAGAFDYIGALSVATKITTVIGLAALAVIVAFLLSSQWLSGRRRQIGQAIEKGDDAALAALLGNLDVDLEGLSPEQKFALGRDQSRQRFWQKMVWQALLFFAFLALLALVWALVQPRPVVQALREPIGTATMTRMLLFVPEDQRAELCGRSLDAAACADIVQSIAGVSRQAPPKVEQQIATSLQQGTVTTGVATTLRRLSPMEQITAGDPKGWDVSFRWCDDANGERNRAAATAAARALAQVPGERIAAGVVLGRILVLPTRTGTPGLPYIAAASSPGGGEAAVAIRRVLLARGQGFYGLGSAAGGRWAIDVVHCGGAAPTIGTAVDGAGS